MTVMEYDILNAVEKIDEACLDAEARVLDAMFEEYTKIFQLTEFCDDQTVLEQFDIFAEADGDKKDDGDELTEGGFWKKKDNTFLKKVVVFIARLVQWIGRKISGSKSSDDNMKKVIDKAEEVSKSVELTADQQKKVDEAFSETEAKEGETPEETNDGNILTKNKKTLITILGAVGLVAAGAGVWKLVKNNKDNKSEDEQPALTDNRGEQKRIETGAQGQTDAGKNGDAPTETSAQGQEVSVDVNKFNGYILLDPGKKNPFATPVNLGKMRGIVQLFSAWSVNQRKTLDKLVNEIKAIGEGNKQVTAKEYVVTFTEEMFKPLNTFTRRTNTTEKDVVDALKNKTFFFNRVSRYSAYDFWQALYMISKNMNTAQEELGRIQERIKTISDSKKVSDNLDELCKNISGKAKLFQDFVNIFMDIRDKMYDDTQLQINVFNTNVDKKGRNFNAALGKYVEKGHENDIPTEGKRTLGKDASELVGKWTNGKLINAKTAEINAERAKDKSVKPKS